MKTLYCFSIASVIALLLFQSPAAAAVISRDWKTPGDGLLTYDDANQREWLDLTESRLSMFQGATLEKRFGVSPIPTLKGLQRPLLNHDETRSGHLRPSGPHRASRSGA